MQQKDEEILFTIETLFKHYYKPLCAYAFHFVNDNELAKDIVQDTFYEIWVRREYLRLEDSSMKSYLFKAVYNQSLNQINKLSEHQNVSLDNDESYELNKYLTGYYRSSEDSILLKELEVEIRTFINSLPPQCKKVFTLSRYYDLKNKEIADQLGISIKAVEKHISKALSLLKQYLTEKNLLSLFYIYISLGLYK